MRFNQRRVLLLFWFRCGQCKNETKISDGVSMFFYLSICRSIGLSICVCLYLRVFRFVFVCDGVCVCVREREREREREKVCVCAC